ncbi:hypothetical protein PG991_012288 [Apiospora marii]|uniref:Autophagy-related protein 27 n=1 Tax=Apiospora marii TaxID=335849 RepID=A0ABR1R9E8_9PEZI
MDTDGQIYLGIWTNWSWGSAVMGATFTTTKSSGNILIAFTATFIPFVASRLWKILCFTFHACHSKRGPQDAIYHQRQVILRNSSSPDSGLFSLLFLMWAWRRLQSKASMQLFPLLIFAVLFLVGFTLAGGYSSQISSAVGDEVLLTGDNCGIAWASGTPTNFTILVNQNALVSTKFANAANYAQQCYSNQGSNIFGCNQFVVRSLPTETYESNYGCPFPSDVCRDNTTNLYLDTGYLDSNTHLGLNAPRDQRFLWRKALSCAPLKTDGYTTSYTASNRTFIRYNYGGHFTGNSTSVNYTYSVPDIQSQYNQTDDANDGMNFRVSAYMGISFNGSFLGWASNFIPDRAINYTDGDVMLAFLSGNGVFFAEESNDAWYRTTRTTSAGLYSEQDEAHGTAYLTSEAASPLGCVQQFQWCNPEYTIPSGCGPLAGWYDAAAGAYPLFNLTGDDFILPGPSPSISERGGRISWATQIIDTDKFGIARNLQTFGAKALSSQTWLSTGIQMDLSKNQWQIDVANWWNTTLAYDQAEFVDTALGRTYEHADITPPANDQERRLCRCQKIRHAGYASFSIFGIAFTYGLGTLIILVSFLLDPIMRCLHNRRKYKQYQYLEWRTNGALQLHRLAQDELGYGEWSGCTDMVPVTRPGNRLADLDIRDLEYPKLNREAIVDEVKPEESNSSSETAGAEQLSTDASENTVLDVDVEHASSEPHLTSEAGHIARPQLEGSEQQAAQGDFILFGEDVVGAQMYLQGEGAENDQTADVPLSPCDYGSATNNEAHGSDIPLSAANATLPHVDSDTTSPRH